ncbi:TPA: hypothetical protein SHW33_002960 [Clostridioides difficile]|uniref:hypothetical protein n=1 Tax=Clostridioides difficile TaxID=1496 RepID=UPI00016C5A52|nr:hypothetical protein [Clostridioides difficile]EGT3828977.1 hypothetical protein [Clostridioides difficile]EGT4199049.1 hypothetical protein [Clostridioides difficile]EJX2691208.1 hypothetical protein [Clostridioides difficile]MBG0232001.1 hypothetical protein [Clostridioides difficile]MBH7253734.1 hypothetical protein [Clostridioides difficile]
MRFSIKDAANAIIVNAITKKPIFYTEDPNTFTFKLESESIYAKAKGANAIAFDGAITSSITIEQEVIQLPQLAMILASDVVEKTAKVGKRELLTSDGAKKVTLKGVKPLQGSLTVHSVEDDGISLIEELQFTSAISGENTEITISSSSFNAGDRVAVFYLTELPKAKTITVNNDSTAPNYTIYADVSVKTAESKLMVLHMTIPNCKAQRSIELGFTAENPSGFNSTLDVLPDSNGNYVEFAFIGKEDVTPVMIANMLGAELIDEKDTKSKK